MLEVAAALLMTAAAGAIAELVRELREHRRRRHGLVRTRESDPEPPSDA